MTSTLKADKIEGVTASGTVQMPAGHVIQMQTAKLQSSATVTSTSFVDVGLSVDITPKFNSSKILLLTSSGSLARSTQYIGLKILRDSTAIHHDYWYQATGDWVPVTITSSAVDSPSSTSALTYKIQCYISGTGTGATLYYNYAGPSTTTYDATITVMEIAQ